MENKIIKLDQSEELFALVENQQSRFTDFHHRLKTIVHEDHITTFKRRNGMTLFEAIILNQRNDLLVSPFFAGVWKEMVDLVFVKREAKKQEDLLKDVREFDAWENSMSVVHKLARVGRIEEVKQRIMIDNGSLNKRDMYGYGLVYWAFVSGNTSMVDFVSTLDIFEPTTNLESIFMVIRRLKYNHLLSKLREFSIRNNSQNQDPSCDSFLSHEKRSCPSTSQKDGYLTLQKEFPPSLIRNYHSTPQRDINLNSQEHIHPSSQGDNQANSPVLVKASLLIKHASLQQIKELVIGGNLDPTLRDLSGKTSLLKAVDNNRLDIVEYLFSLELAWDDKDLRHRNVFHVAAQNCNAEMFSLLYDLMLKKAGLVNTLTLLNQKDKYVGSELCMLLKGKEENQQAWFFVEVFRRLSHMFLVKSKQGGVFDVNKFGEVVISGIGESPSQEDKEKVSQIYDQRKSTLTGFRKDQTPLHIAAYNGGVEIVRQLLQNKAMVDCRDCFGMTPLHHAAVRGALSFIIFIYKLYLYIS